MQTNVEEMQNPDQDPSLETQLSREFYNHLNLGTDSEYEDQENHADYDDEDEEEEEEEFSFMCGEANTSPIAAEDAFINGKIKPIFPLFNQDLLLSTEDFPIKPQVKNVFVETYEEGGSSSSMTSSAPENDGDWSERKAVQVGSPEMSKKSNSTGFSKIWRFKDLLGRSNSDGRDTFVFLNNNNNNNNHVPPEKVEKKEVKVKVKGASKKKTTTTSSSSLSPHEVYLRSKAKADERRRSYLPYKPGLVGLFTNVNGGLTKNVHPY